MQAKQTIAAGRILFDKNAGSKRASVVGQVATFFTTILNVRGRTENFIVSNYKGCGWNDSTERELNNDLANHHCSRF